MNLKKNIIDPIYSIGPYRNLIKNQFKLFLDILFSSSYLTIILKNGIRLRIKRNEIKTLLNLLGILKYSVDCSYNSKNEVIVSFDNVNKFTFSLDLSSPENEKLLELFHYGIKFGAFFQSNSEQTNPDYDKSIKILSHGDKKIIQTLHGLKFYLDSISPWVIIETFIRGIHNIPSLYPLQGKTVVDVGAQFGETPLFYASHGAKVYAFEALKNNFDSMLQNIKLNPKFADKIIPINAAIGKDGILKIHHRKSTSMDGMASLFYKPHGDDDVISEVRGYSLNSARQKFGIKKIDLLNMDCKGCEFLLDENSFDNVTCLKIEYTAFSSHKFQDLISILRKNGFKTTNFLHNSRYVNSLASHGTILAIKN